MALKVNGTSVVDNSRNITNVVNIDSAGISTLGRSVVVENDGGTPTITLDGTSGIATAPTVSADTVKVGTAVTISAGVVTATSFEGSGSSLTGLTGASSGTYGSASQVAQITVDSSNRITSISNVAITGGGGGGGSTTEGIGTALSTDTSSILSIIYKTPVSFTIPNSTTVVVQSDSSSNNIAYTKLDEIIVGSGAVFEIADGTELRMNILDIF